MERILSVIFPCCFPNRYTSSQQNERTPLLHDAAHSESSRNSISESGVATPGSDAKRVKRKHNSILPAPAYDAHVLRNIIDDFKGRLIAVDTGVVGGSAEKGAGAGAGAGVGLLLSSGAETADPVEAEAIQSSSASTGSIVKHVTPVHTLRLAVSSPHPPTASQSKLVDIWSPSTSTPSSTPTSVAPPTTILSYSAAVKRGSATAKTKGKRFSSAAARASTPAPQTSVEQKTYETLAELVRCKPLVHDWELDEAEDAKS
ncbi:uncharacterized protein SPSC_06500 [Sporisorium scitamineum]|uniref:Uncharacterized protein n=1 Tax=Sporisorium scitamineum TaxID=49012 RepID=A0A0F7SD50_9BASI|nr:uncharacterized protein SPSC_06500 [Sporisorium scitamineum]CDW99385.1 hypothetical protein [Sporisorium scitamineum]